MQPTTQDLIQSTLKRDAVTASELFNDIIADKISSSIQSRKLELAQQIFNSSQTDEDNPYDEEDVEDEEEYEDEEEQEEEEDENS